MSTITSCNKLPKRSAGRKFRPMPWTDVRTMKVTFGIEERPVGSRRYYPRGWQGKVDPFGTKQEAQAICNELNVQAASMAAKAAVEGGPA